MGNKESSKQADTRQREDNGTLCDEDKLRSGRPLKRAKKKQLASFQTTSGNIAAIDFGTTGLSLAFTTQGSKDGKANVIALDEHKHNLRVYNGVLLKLNNFSCEVTAIGDTARDDFMRLRVADLSKYIYFEQIKMLLKREENIDRKSKVTSVGGGEYYLVEVIAFILKYLKEKLVDHLSTTITPLKASDFDWVITVPAIWDARGKGMMREAAYLAGLCNNSPGITKFTSTIEEIPRPEVETPDKLTLALEPEVAAIYSKVVASTAAASNLVASASAAPQTETYMVIDIGGGTVDITVHSEVDDNIRVETLPTGNCCGGTRVNERFSHFLQKLVDDIEFKKFTSSGNADKLNALISYLLYTEFEAQKMQFGSKDISELAIDLPSKFVKFYTSSRIENAVEGVRGVTFEDDTLRCERHFVENELFGPVLDGIISCVSDTIEHLHVQIEIIYLVGAFGGCKYAYEKIKEKIHTGRIIVPASPNLAVVQGAVLWRKNPQKINARRADATYGTAVTIPFDKIKHDKHYSFYLKEANCLMCDNVFDVFVEKGELATCSDVFVEENVTPRSQKLESMCFPIYTTPNIGTQYVRDKDGKYTVTQIGQLLIDVPNPNNLPREQRSVDIRMSFSGTELQASAKYSVTGEEVNTVCDFLSSSGQ